MAADVRGQHHQHVGCGQVLARHDIRIAGRGVGDATPGFGHRLVPHRQRASPGPPAQHHPLVAEPLLRVGDGPSEIGRHLLHDEGRVRAAIAGVGPDDVMARTSEAADDRQIHAATGGVHEHQHRVRRPIHGPDQMTIQADDVPATAVDVAERCLLAMDHGVRDAFAVAGGAGDTGHPADPSGGQRMTGQSSALASVRSTTASSSTSAPPPTTGSGRRMPEAHQPSVASAAPAITSVQ